MREPAAEQCRCLLCGAFETDRFAVEKCAIGARVVAHADPDVVVLVGPSARDVVVAPRRHLDRLSMTLEEAARVLSAMRLMVNALRSALGAAGATIEPTLEIGGAGHVSFRVVLTTTNLRGGVVPPNVETMVSLVADALDSPCRVPPRLTFVEES